MAFNEHVKSKEQQMLECKICLDTSREPIVTHCGHLFCWECLYDWSQSRQSAIVPCPCCVKEVDLHGVIPLYASQEEHARNKNIPRRPHPRVPPFQQHWAQRHLNLQFLPFGFNFVFQGNWNPQGAAAPPQRPLHYLLAAAPLLLFFFPLLVAVIENALVNLVLLFTAPFRRQRRAGGLAEAAWYAPEEAGEDGMVLMLVLALAVAVIYAGHRRATRRV